MKNTLQILFLYLGVALFTVSCQEDAPEPNCLQVEVMGADCQTGWYILKIKDGEANNVQGNNYKGQLQSGYVTTNNLPEEYRQPGLKMEAVLEVNGENAPRCVTVTVMYPAVKVTRVCRLLPTQL